MLSVAVVCKWNGGLTCSYMRIDKGHTVLESTHPNFGENILSFLINKNKISKKYPMKN